MAMLVITQEIKEVMEKMNKICEEGDLFDDEVCDMCPLYKECCKHELYWVCPVCGIDD